ncbi:MAG: UbiH/UbiF/VisC/COQ6 family ubiquinone biosynthesis hydroxylase [Povalibacter sp.]
MKPDFDIVVVGGGMVGACLASMLGSERELADLRIALLEAKPPTLPPSPLEMDLRVSAISPASQRILESVDAWSKISASALSPYTEMTVWDAGARPHSPGSIHFSASATSEPYLGHIVENQRIQWALFETAGLRRVTLLRAELTHLDFEDERVQLTLSDGRQIGAGLVVGADGADSLSRRLAGIETDARNYEQRAFVTHVTTELPHQSTAWQRFLPAGPIAFLPLRDGRSSIVWTTTPAHAQSLMQLSQEQLGNELTDALDGILGTVTPAAERAHFPLRLIHSRNYSRERFVLVGDAAHSVHPLAGQGVNLGFLDAAALVQLLAEAASNGMAIAERPLLRRYERWRKSENAIALGLVDGLNELFSNSSATLAWARRVGLTMVDRSRLAKSFLIGRAMGVAGDAPSVVKRLR